jgi:hypothetical protein
VRDLGSLYQPNVTTHQPYCFDTLQTLYRRYRVNAVSIELVFQNTSTNPMTVLWGIVPPGATYSTSTNDDMPNLGEKPQFAVKNLLTRDGGYCSHTVRLVLPSHQICGLTKREFEANTEDYSALVSASPSRSAKLVLNVSSLGTTADVCICACKITYHAELWERIALGQSSE